MTNPSRRNVLVGIGFMLLSVMLFSLNGAIGKWLVAAYPMGQALLIRSLTALVLLAPFLWRAGLAAFTTAPRPRLQVLRATISTIEIVCFFWSVAYLPLADVITFYLATPIYVTALAPFVLNENVGWRRWAAVLIGFAGVLLALKPSTAALTAPALVALAGSLLYAVSLIITRVLRNTANIVLVSSQVATTGVFGLIAAPFGWVTPPPGWCCSACWQWAGFPVSTCRSGARRRRWSCPISTRRSCGAWCSAISSSATSHAST